jgi:threonine aldolase
MPPVSFASDNHSGIHEKILAAISACNSGTAASYEMDDLSQELKKFLRSYLGCNESFLVFNGTAANVLALNTALDSFESVLCTDISHLNVDECGAPEKFLGAKLIAIPHRDGRLTVEDLEKYIYRRGDQHFSQPRSVSITQPTEYGTVYSLDELRAIRAFCDREKMFLHIDGARLGNAVFTLQSSFKEIVSLADVVSLGGTKNGLLGAEMVVVMNAELAENFKFSRKQAMQLPSKTRFMAAQFLTYFKNDLWLDFARHQCELAKYLAARLSDVQISVHYAVQSNAVFCRLSKDVVKALRDEFFFYVWDEKTYECRLMTSFDTKKEDIDRFIDKLATLKR